MTWTCCGMRRCRRCWAGSGPRPRWARSCDWEAALAEAARLEADYQRFTEVQGRPAVLTTPQPAEWSAPGLAAEFGMPTASIHNWIYRGWITARHAPGTRNWIITADDEQMRQLRERWARPPGFYTRAR